MPDAFNSISVDDPRREFAVQVARRLHEAGYQALWAGGCVRDALLGIPPKDYDVATSALPQQVREVFGKRRTLAIGAAFGVITVLGPKKAGQVEVATFRTDASYTDGRRPDAVHYSDPQQDAARRDFTINGLFYDPVNRVVVDYVDGQKDLQRRLIRAIGDAEQRIAEDKLRMLRAVRFAATLGFEIAADTAAAIEAHAGGLGVVSVERIAAELERMLLCPQRVRAVRLLRQLGLLDTTLPELSGLTTDALEHRLAVLGRLSSPRLPVVLAGLLSPAAPCSAGKQLGRRLKLPNEVSDNLSWLLRSYPVTARADKAPWPQVQRVLIHPYAADLLAWSEAESGGTTPATGYCRQKLALPSGELDPPPLIDGRDLIAVGFRPGPGFATLLKTIRDKQLLGELASKPQAMEYAQQVLSDRDA